MDSLEVQQGNQGSFPVDGEHGISLHAMQGIGPHLMARGKSHGFSRVAAGTCGIFLSYGMDSPSKLLFAQ